MSCKKHGFFKHNRNESRHILNVTETGFFAAHLMVITFYMRSRLWPFKKAENPDVRTTDDHFLMEVAVNNNEEELVSFFQNTGAVEVKVIEKHE